MLHVALLLGAASALVVPLPAARPAKSLDISLPRLSDGASVHLGDALAQTTTKTMLCFGTHAADFNAIVARGADGSSVERDQTLAPQSEADVGSSTS